MTMLSNGQGRYTPHPTFTTRKSIVISIKTNDAKNQQLSSSS